MNKQELIEKCLEKTREYLETSIPESIEKLEIDVEYFDMIRFINPKTQDISEFVTNFYI